MRIGLFPRRMSSCPFRFANNTFSRPVLLKLKCARESLGELVESHIPGPHSPQRPRLRRSEMILMLLARGPPFELHWARPLRIVVLMLDRLGLLHQFPKLLFGPSFPKVLMAPEEPVCSTTFLFNRTARSPIPLTRGKEENCLLWRI